MFAPVALHVEASRQTVLHPGNGRPGIDVRFVPLTERFISLATHHSFSLCLFCTMKISSAAVWALAVTGCAAFAPQKSAFMASNKVVQASVAARSSPAFYPTATRRFMSTTEEAAADVEASKETFEFTVRGSCWMDSHYMRACAVILRILAFSPPVSSSFLPPHQTNNNRATLVASWS